MILLSLFLLILEGAFIIVTTSAPISFGASTYHISFMFVVWALLFLFSRLFPEIMIPAAHVSFFGQSSLSIHTIWLVRLVVYLNIISFLWQRSWSLGYIYSISETISNILEENPSSEAVRVLNHLPDEIRIGHSSEFVKIISLIKNLHRKFDVESTTEKLLKEIPSRIKNVHNRHDITYMLFVEAFKCTGRLQYALSALDIYYSLSIVEVILKLCSEQEAKDVLENLPKESRISLFIFREFTKKLPREFVEQVLFSEKKCKGRSFIEKTLKLDNIFENKPYDLVRMYGIEYVNCKLCKFASIEKEHICYNCYRKWI